jgi:hypothetical protein
MVFVDAALVNRRPLGATTGAMPRKIEFIKKFL